MPKIPTFVSTSGAPASIPYGSASGVPGAAPFQALAAGANDVQSAAQAIQVIEQHKRREAQTNEAIGLLLSATDQISSAEEELKVGKRDPDTGALLETPATSKDYYERFQGKVKDITSETLQKTTDPGVRTALQRMLLRTQIERGIQARHFSTRLFVDEQKAEADDFERQSLKLAASAPTDEERNTYADIYRVWLSSKGGVLGQEDIGRRLSKFNESLAEHQARVEIRAGTFEPDKYAGTLRPDRIDQLIVTEATTQAKARTALDRAVRIWSESVERETETRIARRGLTAEWIEEYKTAFTSEKLKAYYKALDDQAVGSTGGDPTTIRELSVMVSNRTNPRQDPSVALDRITAAYTSGAIGLDRYAPWSTELGSEITRRQSEGKAARNEGETRVRELQGRRFNAAMQNAELAFRTTNQFENFDASATEALTQMREELQRRADYLGEGSEDALSVYREVLPKYIGQVSSRSESRLSFLAAQIRYPDVQRLTADRARIGDRGYYDQLRMLQEQRGITAELARLQAIQDALMGKVSPSPQPKTPQTPTTAGAPSPSSTNPRERALR